jgi:MinD-like ATPase involved in chromosome partitioning or flagellar assembly
MSYAQDHAGIRVVGTVLSLREAVEQSYDVLLIDDTTSYLTKRLIARVHAVRRLVIGVYEGPRGDVGRSKLVEIGVDAVIDAEASPKEFLARIRSITDQQMIDRDFAEMVGSEGIAVDTVAPGEVATPAEERYEDSSLTVVSGSNGVVEISLGLASQFARRRLPCVLVDFDTVEPALAQRLGAPLSPNLLSAVESLRFSGEIGAALVRHQAGFGFLAGLPSPREWEACGVDDADDLIDVLAATYSNVIVRIHRQLEDLAPFGSGGGRFDVARRLVAKADQLVVVGDPSPVGVTAVLAWIGEARTLSGGPVHVVMNHCGRSMYQRGEIIEEIGRTFRSASVTFAPEDPRVRKAAWQGEIPAQGRFAKALDELVPQLAGGVGARTGNVL